MTVVSDYTALLSNYQWWITGGAGQAVVLTYSFSQAADPDVVAKAHGADVQFHAFSATDQALTQQKLADWSAVSGITFIQTTESTGDITFGYYNLNNLGAPPKTAGDTYQPSPGAYLGANNVPGVYSGTSGTLGGDVLIDDSYQGGNSDLGHVLIHEIGHALGLKHPFDTSPDITLTPTLDNGDETVMSYTGARNDTLGPLDTSAIQYLYGAAGSARPAPAWSWNAATETFTEAGSGDDQFLRGVGAAHDIVYAYGLDDAVATTQGDDIIYTAGQRLSVNGGAGTNAVATGLLYSGTSFVFGSTSYASVQTSTGWQSFYDIQYLVFGNGVYDLTNSSFISGAAIGNASPALQAVFWRTLASAPAAAADESTVTLTGAHTAYTLARSGNGQITIADSVAGRNGTNTYGLVRTLNFADGQGRYDPTGNAGEAARLYQAAFDRGADAGGLDYWTIQLDAATLNLGQVAQDFVTSSEFAERYGALDNRSFVQLLYQNVLGRTGDAGGISYWSGALASGQSRASVLTGFSDSFENEYNTMSTIDDPTLSEAYRLYQAAFNRTPDTSGLSYWATQLAQGMSPLMAAGDFMASAEFTSLYGTPGNSALVTDLYQNVLHRAPDASGDGYWIGQLNGGISRANVLLDFSDSPENRFNTASATHDGWVFI